MSWGFWVVVGIVVAAVVWLISMYNGLVAQRNRFKNAFAQIDVHILHGRFNLARDRARLPRAQRLGIVKPHVVLLYLPWTWSFLALVVIAAAVVECRAAWPSNPH